MLRRLIVICWMLLASASMIWAQNTATNLPISYGQTVSGALSSTAFFDHWQVHASAHDQLYVRMTASDGLQPLIGILDANGTLLTRSADGQTNGAIDLNFDVPQAGLYIIVATRVGNENGTSTGSYTLEVETLNPTPTRNPQYQDVTFQCGASDATAAASLQFARDASDNGEYSIRVYGLDGFQPVIRVQSGSGTSCITDPADALGDVITLPGERPLTLTQADLSHTVQAVLTGQNVADPSSITVTVGSADGQPGRYLAVIGGFAIEPSNNLDSYTLRLAPRPAQGGAALLFYVIAVNSRLDPSVVTETSRCDDAGRRGCEDVPSALNVGVILNNGVSVTGNRFDAGARIVDADPHQVQVMSFSGTTHGEYAVLLIGSLPPAP